MDSNSYDGKSFKLISKSMMTLVSDGSIKKKILQRGQDAKMPHQGIVSIQYRAYLEHSLEPFLSTYVNNKPFCFRLNSRDTILGLELAVASMTVNEKSQFLIENEYTYGSLGNMRRLPRNCTILFEIEVIDHYKLETYADYQNLPPEKQNAFNEMYKYAHALCTKGNNLYKQNLYILATKAYNLAVSNLETCQLRDYSDQKNQEQLLLRILINLVVTYTKLQEPRLTCAAASKIYNIATGTSLKVPTKVHFNHARSLTMLSEYEWAEKILKQAQQMEPQNLEISKEILKLDEKKKESYNREVTLAKTIFKNMEINTEPDELDEITKEFQASMVTYCKNLRDDVESTQYNLPYGLTKSELSFCSEVVKNYGLKFERDIQDASKYYISKPSAVDTI